MYNLVIRNSCNLGALWLVPEKNTRALQTLEKICFKRKTSTFGISGSWEADFWKTNSNFENMRSEGILATVGQVGWTSSFDKMNLGARTSKYTLMRLRN